MEKRFTVALLAFMQAVSTVQAQAQDSPVPELDERFIIEPELYYGHDTNQRYPFMVDLNQPVFNDYLYISSSDNPSMSDQGALFTDTNSSFQQAPEYSHHVMIGINELQFTKETVGQFSGIAFLGDDFDFASSPLQCLFIPAGYNETIDYGSNGKFDRFGFNITQENAELIDKTSCLVVQRRFDDPSI